MNKKLITILYSAIFFVFLSLLCLLSVQKASAESPAIIPDGFSYPPEHIYDTRRYTDEALVNVQIESNRWPHCHTFETAIQSIFRIEGVGEKSDEEKALALWKWIRILMSATPGKFAYEGAVPGKETIVFDGHKILTVYGHHRCDGLSFAMVPLWRAAGYIAFDEASHRHTTASLRYRDHDGQYRFHSFDPRGGFLWWNPDLNIVGNRTLPLMQDSVHRHLTLRQKVHSLRTSLHLNETLERQWDNVGHVVQSGRQLAEIKPGEYFQYHEGRTDGVYSSVGTEIQRFSPDVTPERYHLDLFEGSDTVSCTQVSGTTGLIHPAAAGKTAEVVYRIHSPYVGVDATLELELRRLHTDDLFRLYLSRDGKHWEMIYDASEIGDIISRIDLGRKQRAIGQPHIYTAYAFYLKAEMSARRAPTDVGLKQLNLTVHRMLNKRTLPNLLAGENIFKVNADALLPGKALEVTIDYLVNGKALREQHQITGFPYYFRIYIRGAQTEIRNNYDKAFGLGDIRMKAIKLQLVDTSGELAPSPSMLEPETGEHKFMVSKPHPSGKLLLRKRNMKRTETDLSQTNGFFPQYTKPLDKNAASPEQLSQLENLLRNGRDSSPKTWRAAEQLGNYPESIDTLLAELPTANIDLTLFICKSLAKLRDPKAIGPLLKKWEMAPNGAPGTRYIPDALAAIGDPGVVPDLVAKLKQVRFDYRFHIVHALGILGGKTAEQALMDLSENDPFPAIREEAGEALKRLHNGKK